MSIYILEDNIYQNTYLQKTIQLLCQKHQYNLGTIAAYSHPQTILESCEASTEAANLYFLDIKIKKNETAGLAVAKQIRALEPLAFIAFVTSYAEFALASYEYMTNAFAYILKTDDKAFQVRINDCLQAYARFLNNQSSLDYFIYEDRFTNLKIPYHELLYIFTVSQHKIGVKTIDQEIFFHGSLKQLEEAEPRLIRCHQSYLVNLENAKMIDKSGKCIVFGNGISVPIARKAMKTVECVWKDVLRA